MTELHAKDAGALLKLSYQGLTNLGVDADKVIELTGIDREQLYDSQLRTSHAAQALFWKAAEDVSGDPYIGLHLGAQMPVYKSQVFSYLFSSSPTFGDGLRRMLNYRRLVSDAFKASLNEEQDPCFISFSFSEGEIKHLIECSCGVIIKFLRYVTDESLDIERIELAHQSKAPIGELEKTFACPVQIACAENRIYFPRQALSFRSLFTQPELFDLHEQLANRQLAHLERQDLVVKVQKQIAALLESSDVNVDIVAAKLEMNPRALRNQLSDAGTSFSQVLNDYRHRLARRLLARTSDSIAEIVYLTGFSEPSTFYRAFKRWEGMTPIEFRHRMQSGDDNAQG